MRPGAVWITSAFGLLACGAPAKPTPAPLANVGAPPKPALRDASGIPVAPIDHRTYEAWYAQLSGDDRAAIDAFCTEPEHLLHESDQCGGIGPLHIPAPPSLVAPRKPGARTHAQWEASLTPAQHAFYEQHCMRGNEVEGYSQLCGGTPLVIDLADAPVEFVAHDGYATDWPTAVTPWLAMDRDGDGAITSSAELFGPDAVPGARNGFDALAVLDANGDGVIDARDPAFATLLVWADRDANRVSSPDELSPLSAVVDSIPLANTRVPRCDARRNCEGERAPLSPRGSIVDVYLHYQ